MLLLPHSPMTPSLLASETPESMIPASVVLAAASLPASSRGEVAASGRREVVASGGGEIAASGRGEVAASGRGEVAASGRGEVVPSGGGEVVPSGGGEVAASGRGEVVASPPEAVIGCTLVVHPAASASTLAIAIGMSGNFMCLLISSQNGGFAIP
jgi:hypothetical protein